jgi:hypothetical protein
MLLQTHLPSSERIHLSQCCKYEANGTVREVIVIAIERITNVVTTFKCNTRRSRPKTNNKFSLFISIITPIYFKVIFVTNQYKILGVSNSLFTSGNYLDCFCSQICVERLYKFHITLRVMCAIVNLLFC